MKGEQRCSNCRFFRDGVPPGVMPDEADGVCRRSPPRVVSSRGERAQFPLVVFDSWCGHWVAEKPDTADAILLGTARAVLAGDLTAARAMADRLNELD